MIPSEYLVYSTVRIETVSSEGKNYSGTGFFFNFARGGGKQIPAIVTNKHVVKDMVKGAFVVHLADESGNAPSDKNQSVILMDFEKHWVMHPDAEVDLCVLPVGHLHEVLTGMGKKLYSTPIDDSIIPSASELEELSPVEDILMVGYPNGIWDKTNNRPVFRMGVTATHPGIDYEGKANFMIDAACFPGSSGSPVFLYNIGGYMQKNGTYQLGGHRFKLLGVLHSGPQQAVEGQIKIIDIPTKLEAITQSQIMINLGIVAKSELLKVFDRLLLELLQLEEKKLSK